MTVDCQIFYILRTNTQERREGVKRVITRTAKEKEKGGVKMLEMMCPLKRMNCPREREKERRSEEGE